jgi:hypothetical protein
MQRQARRFAEENLDWQANSANLPDWIEQAARHRSAVSSELIDKIKKYEYSKYPYPAYAIPLVRMMRYRGREIKHLIRRRIAAKN